MSTEVRNAIITSATLSTADHGVLSGWVHLDYGGAGQGFGGYSLYLPDTYTHAKGQPNLAGHFIWRVLEVAGVSEWTALTGKTVRVRSSHSSVEAIGHIVKDIWFCPAVEFKAMTEGAAP